MSFNFETDAGKSLLAQQVNRLEVVESLLVTGHEDNTIRLLDPRAGKCV